MTAAAVAGGERARERESEIGIFRELKREHVGRAKILFRSRLIVDAKTQRYGTSAALLIIPIHCDSALAPSKSHSEPANGKRFQLHVISVSRS